MSDEKTTNLSSITGANLADNDLVMVVDVSDTTMAATGTNKKVTLDEFAQDSTFSSRYGSSGTGSPEGVVTAAVGARYVDTAATTGAILWVKASGSGNTGWKVSHADSGWRSIAKADLGNPANITNSFTVRFRRVNDFVTLRVQELTLGASWVNDQAAANIITLPTGLAISTKRGADLSIIGRNSSTGGVVFYATSGTTVVPEYGATAGQGTGAVTLSYLTDDAWFASLPGTAL